MYPTPERRASLHTNMAVAWWMQGDPRQTADALLSAYRQAPSEVQGRPTMRKIADDLVVSHPRVPAVRELAKALHRAS
ncbi:hypothetical protein [Sphaerisporangium sp. NPDC051011]|uniref:hypothetical protein n=1 Tax=Sphaerisporangium sp. NPDC051011 TaxID=3155792 RepID=UPI0033D7E064